MGQNSSHKMCSPGLSLSSGLGDKKEGLCCCPGELGPGVLVSVSRNVAGSGRADTVVSFECCRKVVHQPHLAMSNNYCVGHRKSWRQTTSEMTNFLYQPWKEHGQTEALLMCLSSIQSYNPQELSRKEILPVQLESWVGSLISILSFSVFLLTVLFALIPLVVSWSLNMALLLCGMDGAYWLLSRSDRQTCPET